MLLTEAAIPCEQTLLIKDWLRCIETMAGHSPTPTTIIWLDAPATTTIIWLHACNHDIEALLHWAECT